MSHTTFVARLAATAALLLVLHGCGGGDVAAPPIAQPPQPTALPATLAVAAAATAEPGADVAFGSDLANPAAGLTLTWDFGDGSSASGAAPAHRYAQPGDYTVVLTVTNEAGATRSAQATVAVRRLSIVQGGNCSGAAGSGWCWQQPKPTGNQIATITFAPGQVAWALGQAGTVFKSTDAGLTWQARSVPTTATLLRAHFVDADNGWLLGEENTLLRTRDGGATWQAQATGAVGFGGFNVAGFLTLNAEAAVMLDGSGNAFVTRDGGESWASRSVGFGVALGADGVMWRQQGGQVQRSADLGETFATVLTLGPQAFFTTDPRPLAGVGAWVVALDFSNLQPPFFSPNVQLWVSLDKGATWQAKALQGLNPNGFEASTLTLYADGRGWVLSGGLLMRTTDHGQSWAAANVPPGAQGLGFGLTATLDADTVIAAVGFSGERWVTRNGGATWSAIAAPAGNGGFFFDQAYQLGANGHLWLLSGGRHYRSADNGANWTSVFGPTGTNAGNPRVAGLWFHDARQGIAVAAGGFALETADAGITWASRQLTPTPTFGDRATLQFQTSSLGWLTLGGSDIYRSTDGGKSWFAPLSPELGVSIQALHFADADNGFAVRADQSLLRSRDGGGTWAVAGQLPLAATGLHFLDADTGVAIGSSGLVARTTDGGSTWRFRPSGTTAQLTKVVGAPGGTLWATGQQGLLLRSNDRGLNWLRVPVPTTSTLNALAFADAQNGWAVGESGTLLATRDGGTTWLPQASGTVASLTSVFALDAFTAWVGTAEGGVLATATGGR